jgi:hypothetical protein
LRLKMKPITPSPNSTELNTSTSEIGITIFPRGG